MIWDQIENKKNKSDTDKSDKDINNEKEKVDVPKLFIS